MHHWRRLNGRALRLAGRKVLAIIILLSVWQATRLTNASLSQERSVTASFAFKSTKLHPVTDGPYRYQRPVEPQLRKIRSWISAVGASIAFADLRDVGLSRDICWVDPRTNTVTIMPAPGTKEAYKPFALNPAPLPYSRATMAPTGCLPGDFIENGWTDLLVYYWGRSPVLFIRRPNVPLSPAAFTPEELLPRWQRWYTDSAIQADITGNGHADLIIGNYFPDGSKILDAKATSDPAFSMNSSMTHAHNGGGPRIFLWEPPGPDNGANFKYVPNAFSYDVAHSWTLAMGAYDLTGGCLPDLYFANDFGADTLLVNRSTPGHVRLFEVKGEHNFFAPKSDVLGYDSFKGMGVTFGDLTSDSRPDIFVSNISAVHGLMENNFVWADTGGPLKPGYPAPFVNESFQLGLARTGWGWDAKIGDFNNEGRNEIVQTLGFVRGKHNLWPEIAQLAMANDNMLGKSANWPDTTAGWGLESNAHPAFFAPMAGRQYVNIGPLLGFDTEGITRAIAVGDVYGNGLLDLAIAGQWTPSFFYRNVSSHPGEWLELRLMRPLSKRPFTVLEGAAGDAIRGIIEIGAEATITLPNGKRYSAQVDGGNGHAGVEAPELHFGLGKISARSKITVLVSWRATDGLKKSRSFVVTPGRWSVLLSQVFSDRPGATHGHTLTP
jgi:enediyne biosynthesis protein E4